MKKFVLALFLGHLLVACSTPTPKGAEIGPRIPEKEYKEKMAAKTQSDKKYDGFYQLYEAHITLIDSDVQSLVLQRKSDVFQWEEGKAQKEREKMFQENSSQTKFFLMMFTPKAKLTDLHRGNSMWKIHLDINGQRYEATAAKVQGHMENTQAIYPNLNRFSTPYEISFDAPLSLVENNKAVLTLTSALGTSRFNF